MTENQETKVYMYTPIEVTFDHTLCNVYESCGLTDEQYKDLGERYDAMIRETPRGCRSKFIQLLMDHFNPLEAMIIMDNVAEANKYREREQPSMNDLMRKLMEGD